MLLPGLKMGIFVQHVRHHYVLMTIMEYTLHSHMAAIMLMSHLILSIPQSTACGHVRIQRLGVLVLM